MALSGLNASEYICKFPRHSCLTPGKKKKKTLTGLQMTPCQCSSGLPPKAAPRSCVPLFPSCVLFTSASGMGKTARTAPLALAAHPTNCPCMAVGERSASFRNPAVTLPILNPVTFHTHELSLTLGRTIEAVIIFLRVPQPLRGRTRFQSAMSNLQGKSRGLLCIICF